MVPAYVYPAVVMCTRMWLGYMHGLRLGLQTPTAHAVNRLTCSITGGVCGHRIETYWKRLTDYRNSQTEEVATPTPEYKAKHAKISNTTLVSKHAKKHTRSVPEEAQGDLAEWGGQFARRLTWRPYSAPSFCRQPRRRGRDQQTAQRQRRATWRQGRGKR